MHGQQYIKIYIHAHFGKQIRNTWKVLIWGAGEGWRSVGQIVQETKKSYK